MNWFKLIALILGEAEAVVPVFLHNANSQKIEAIVVTTVNDAVAVLAAVPAPVQNTLDNARSTGLAAVK
jgi:hypothetical protein